MARSIRLVVAAAALEIIFTAAAAAQTASSRILVMPFENVKREASIVWVGEAAALLLADDLNALGAAAITREERREAFERLQVPAGAALTDATVIRIGQLVGASEAVMGSLQLDGETLVVHARSIALESGRIDHDIIERGPMPQMFATFGRVARQLRPEAKTSAAAQPPPDAQLAAFERYVRGLLAETPATAINYLKTSLTAMPSFDRARLALWDVYAEQGNHAQALAAVVAVPADSMWSRRARFLSGLSYLHLSKNDDAFTVFKALADAAPTAATFNNMGVAQIRRGSSAQGGMPSSFFKRASEIDKEDSDYFFNLGYASWQARDTQATIYWLREAVRRNPTDGDAHFILGTALAAGGSAAEAARERELARRLSSAYAQWEKRPQPEAVPKGLERIKGDIELPHAQRVDVTLVAGEQRDQRELAQFYLDRGRRLFQQENDRDAVAELNRALYLSPYEAEAHVLVGRIHLRNNRVREAIDAFKIALRSSETAQAHVALGDAYLQAKQPDGARSEAERAIALDPGSHDARQLLERIGVR
jgi:tetratricopeptide (TPR) repeat protein